MSRALVSARSDARASASPAIDVTAGALACLLVWITFVPFAALDIDPFHDGLMLKPALDVAAGQTLFRDTLMMYGPLTTGLQATALALFGRTLLVLRLSTVFAYGIVAGLLVVCWRFILPRPLAMVAGALWFLFSPIVFAVHPWPSVYALCFQVGALLTLMRAVASSRHGWALASGVLAGLTWLSRQFPTGLFTCLGVVAAFAAVALLFPAYRRRALVGIVGASAGIALVMALSVVHLIGQGSLHAWWEQTIVWAWKWSQSSSGKGILVLQCLDMWWPYGMLFCAVAVALLLLVRDGRPLTAALALGLAAVCALLATRCA